MDEAINAMLMVDNSHRPYATPPTLRGNLPGATTGVGRPQNRCHTAAYMCCDAAYRRNVLRTGVSIGSIGVRLLRTGVKGELWTNFSLEHVLLPRLT